MSSGGEPHHMPSSECPEDLKCVPFSSLIGSGFWHKFSNIVLNKIKLTKEKVPIHGYYTRSVAPALFSVEFSSFESTPQGERHTVATSGHIINTNTVEEFRDVDKNDLIRTEGQALVDLLSTPEGMEKIASKPSLLVPFFLLTYANLKNYSYKYWFAFPAISAIKMSVCNREELSSDHLTVAIKQNEDIITSGFFLVNYSEATVEVRPLNSRRNGNDIYAFLDTSSVEPYPSWVIRNYIAYVIRRESLQDGDTLKVFGVRLTKNGIQGRIYHIQVKFDKDFLSNPKIVGWERNPNGKLIPQAVDLKSSLDPSTLCESSVDFNLKLMKWRLFPSFDLDKLHSTRCLLLGAGTLGCNVARCLMAWGVRHITLVDNSTVNYSNPVRQSLFTFQDCVENKPKAEAAAEALRLIYPGVVSSGVRILVPMPGHPVSPATLNQVTEDFKTLEKCVQECDVMFLLMDTREARWLPTVMGAAENKIVINAALGFDSYVVMRHGDSENKLGCYFCTDVVAPGNSTRDRTMDQQCTVTRPGVSYIASALSVELLLSLLHNTPESPLGSTPHSIRGFLSSGEYLMPTVGAFDKCTACSPLVLKEYKERNLQFVLDALNESDYLERLTGLDKIKDQDLLDGIVELDDDYDLDD